MWRRNVATIIAGGLLAILLVVYMSTYHVRFNEVAIVKTLGRVSYVEKKPGLRACWPWPIQQVIKYDLRVNVLQDPLSEAQTQGGKAVTAQAFMAWRIKDPELFLTKVGSVSQVAAQLRSKLKSQKEAVLGNYSLDNFVSTNAADLKLPEVEKALRQYMNAWANEMFGVEVLAVGINRLGVPAGTSGEIFEAMKEGRGELIKRYQAEGQAEATRITSEADRISKQILSFASLLRRAAPRRGRGQGRRAVQGVPGQRVLRHLPQGNQHAPHDPPDQHHPRAGLEHSPLQLLLRRAVPADGNAAAPAAPASRPAEAAR